MSDRCGICDCPLNEGAHEGEKQCRRMQERRRRLSAQPAAPAQESDRMVEHLCLRPGPRNLCSRPHEGVEGADRAALKEAYDDGFQAALQSAKDQAALAEESEPPDLRAQLAEAKAEVARLRSELDAAIEYHRMRGGTMNWRCEVCDWPMATETDRPGACVPGNCSYRPREGTEQYRRIQERKRWLAKKPAATAQEGVDRAALKEAYDVRADERARCVRQLRAFAEAVSVHGRGAYVVGVIDAADALERGE